MKKRRLIKSLCCFFAVLLLLAGCTQPQNPPTETDTMPNDINQDVIGCYKTTEYSYLTAVDASILTTNLNEAYLLLANKEHPLGATYVPSDLVDLTCPKYQSWRTYQLDRRAANALYAMLAEMKAAGIDDVMVASAYRSYSYQVSTYNNHIAEERNNISEDAIACFGYDYIKTNYLDRGVYKLSLEDATTVVQTYSAQPGKSEHQTGLCVDLATSEEKEPLTVAFELTQAFAWLSQNAYKFGFILRYPNGDEDVTGYTYEPWHYRFVGREAATDIHFGNLNFEEYLYLYRA